MSRRPPGGGRIPICVQPPLAFETALAINDVDRLELVSVGCQTSIPAVAGAHGARLRGDSNPPLDCCAR